MKRVDKYVSYNGKRLRKGYTTGSCATAATIAAIQMMNTQKEVHQVNLTTPSGVELVIPIHNCEISKDSAKCSVQKDGGDDADATHGIHIYSTVSRRDDLERILVAGKGIGIVTEEGLENPIGEPAINSTPRKMIKEAIDNYLPEGEGVTVEISVPEGEEVAKGTMNPRLGILGGISILGTSGIVTPMSEDSWKQSITIEMQQKKNLGYDRIILTPGNYGEDFIKEYTNFNPKYMVQMSNFVGYVLMEAMRLKFKKILLVGHLGKFIKIAGGIFSTHSKDADARSEIMVANLALMGAPVELLQEVDKALTTEKQAKLIISAGYESVYQDIVNKIKKRSWQLFEFRNPDIEVEAVAFLKENDILASSKPMKELEEEWS